MVGRRTIWGAGAAVLICTALLAADLLFPPPLERFLDQSVEVRAGDGSVLRTFLSNDDKWRLHATPADVDPAYLSALRAFEDKRFDHHVGIDPIAVLRAATQNLTHGEVVSGASTLTMQAARLLEPGGRGLAAKLRQSLRALQLERRFSKDEILSIYLTLAPFGGNIEGVRAASWSYFQKEPKRLRNNEIALLVALPQSPERLRPDRFPQNARAAQIKVLERLLEEGLLRQKTVAEVTSDLPVTKRHALPFVAPHFAQTVKQMTSDRVIKTFIDKDTQKRLERLAKRETRWFRDGGNMAVVVVHNKTQQVQAYLGGADYWGRAGQIDLARAVRSPGSTLKPFIYGMAFDDMPLHPYTYIEDRPTLFGDYAPRNFSRNFQGTVTVREALQWSLNVPAVALMDRLGPQRFHSRLSLAGADLVYAGRHAEPSLPLALGGVGMRLRDLTTLYASFAHGGVVAPLRLFEADGRDAATRFRLMSEEASWYVTDILSGSALPDGLGQGQGFDRGRPIAFKTGTSYGFRDAWSIGVSPTHTVGVWIGRADGSTRAGRYGRNEAAPILMKVFDLLPVEKMPGPAIPQNVLVASENSDLPAAMQRFKPKPLVIASGKEAPLQIMFPPNGATVSLPDSEQGDALALRSTGGKHPIRWMVDGRLLEKPAGRKRTQWTPDAIGFSNVTAIDAAGHSATSRIRLVAP